MKKLLVFSLLSLCLSQLFTTACHKSTDPPEIMEPTDSITPIDTISPIDTTIITPAGDSVHYRYIYLTETNTNLPIAHCRIALFTRFYAPQENQMLTLAALHPFDTTILLRNFASFSHGYKIRYLVDFSSYQTYTSSGLSRPLQIAFPAVDTGYVNIVIE